MGGGGSSTNTVTKSDPWVGAQPYLSSLMGQASKLYGSDPNGIDPYTGPQVATTPDWLRGIVQSGMGTTAGQTTDAQNAMWSSLSNALNPTSTGWMPTQAGMITPASLTGAQMGYAGIEGSGIDANSAINNALYGNGMSPFLDSIANDMVNKTQQSWGNVSRDMWGNLQESTLPGIEDQFNAAGSLGASRQALMEGQAVGKTNDALMREYGDMNTNLQGSLANLYGGAYDAAQNRSASLASQMAGLGSNERISQADLIQQMLYGNANFSQQAGLSNLDAYMQAMMANQGMDLQSQLANQAAGLDAAELDVEKIKQQMMAGTMIPGVTQFPLAMGSSIYNSYLPFLNEQQALYDTAQSSYYDAQMAPWEALARYAGVVQPNATVGGSSGSSNDYDPSTMETAGTAVSTAASLAMMYFLASTSDRRTKTDIRRVGSTDGGLPIYAFRYKWGGPIQMGVMADEVAQVKPEAVVRVNGIDRVFYDMID